MGAIYLLSKPYAGSNGLARKYGMYIVLVSYLLVRDSDYELSDEKTRFVCHNIAYKSFVVRQISDLNTGNGSAVT